MVLHFKFSWKRGTTTTAGGMRAAGYKTLVVHVYSYDLGIDPDTGAPLKKKKKISQIEKYEFKK